ncbi:MAG: cell division protein ZapA [Raineya sp.]
MSQILSIRLKIADRDYPMQVTANEEAQIRAVGREINMAIKGYRDEYQIDNNQDLLAMFAVDCMMKKHGLEREKEDLQNIVLQKINDLDKLLNSVL